MTTETTTTTRATREQMVATLKDAATLAIEAAGFTTETNFRGVLKVRKAGVLLGEVDFRSVRPSIYPEVAFPCGTVEFEPSTRSWRSSRSQQTGRYNLKGGEWNLKGLVSRLRAEVAKAEAAVAEAKAWRAREKSDDAIRADILGVEVAVVDDVDQRGVSVFDGKVDLKLSDLSPEVAKAVLALVAKA